VAAIGQVGYVAAPAAARSRRFRTARALGARRIQIDIPDKSGVRFPVDMLRLAAPPRERAQSVITAPAGALVEVELPPEYPQIPIGAPVYCSSSRPSSGIPLQRPKRACSGFGGHLGFTKISGWHHGEHGPRRRPCLRPTFSRILQPKRSSVKLILPRGMPLAIGRHRLPVDYSSLRIEDLFVRSRS
jgi:hypothetical protein